MTSTGSEEGPMVHTMRVLYVGRSIEIKGKNQLSAFTPTAMRMQPDPPAWLFKPKHVLT